MQILIGFETPSPCPNNSKRRKQELHSDTILLSSTLPPRDNLRGKKKIMEFWAKTGITPVIPLPWNSITLNKWTVELKKPSPKESNMVPQCFQTIYGRNGMDSGCYIFLSGASFAICCVIYRIHGKTQYALSSILRRSPIKNLMSATQEGY